MAWRAIFQGAEDRDGAVVWTTVYTDETKKVAHDYSARGAVVNENVQALARREVDALSQTTKNGITIVKGADIDLTPPVPDPPSDKDVARAKFFADLGKLRQLEELVSFGVGSDDAVTKRDAQLTLVNAEYLPDYF